MRNVLPKLESSKLNGVATIAKTYTHINTAEFRYYIKTIVRGDR